VSLRQKVRDYFFLAATFFLAGAFLAGFFDAGDLVVFLAMNKVLHLFSAMARKFFFFATNCSPSNCQKPQTISARISATGELLFMNRRNA
jgi:hypothetical protein